MKKLLALVVVLCLWQAAGAQYSLIKQDVNSQMGSGAARFTSFKDKTYFIANDGTHGYELWWSDGHSYGMVADINPGSADAFAPGIAPGYNFCVQGNSLYFMANDSVQNLQLWEYDGNNAPKKRTGLGNDYRMRGGLGAVGNMIYFKALEVASSRYMIFSFNPQTHAYLLLANAPWPANLEPIASLNGKLVYSRFVGAGGTELCEYDPIADTTWTWDLNLGAGSSGPGGFYRYNNTLFFHATSDNYGRELYRYDAFSAPRRISDIRFGNTSSFGNSDPLNEKMAVYNNKLYFMAMTTSVSGNRDLYSYNPVTDVVQVEKYVNSFISARGMAVYRNKLYIATDSNAGQNQGLFIYDGNNLRPFSSLGFSTFGIPLHLAESNGRLYFSDWDNASLPGQEVYVFTDSLALDVPEVNVNNMVTVYPNPATSDVHFSFSLNKAEQLHLQITDMQGRVVYTATKSYNTGKHEVIVPVRELAAGVYIYAVMNWDGEVLGRGKLIKQ